MHQRLEFGSDAIAYIRLQLSTRESFWQCLCELPLERGRVFSYLPLTPSTWELLHFAWHINPHLGEVDYSYRNKEQEPIAEFLLSSDNHIAVLHGLTAPPGQKAIEAAATGVMTYFRKKDHPNNYSADVPTITEVYHVVGSGVAGSDLDRALSCADRAPYMVALTSWSPGATLPIDRCFDESGIRMLASRTESILMGAFGGDATLIWTRA